MVARLYLRLGLVDVVRSSPLSRTYRAETSTTRRAALRSQLFVSPQS